MIREWTWEENEMDSAGLTLYTDRVVRWTSNWSAPFTDMGRDWTIDEFCAEGSSIGIPPLVWKELNEEIAKLRK